MPRPCQKRRASAAANRKPKPAAPPPIRHKARQKAIHNARRGRGGAHTAGRASQRSQRIGEISRFQEEDFVSFSKSGSTFDMHNGSGSSKDPILLQDSDYEDGEGDTDDSDADSDDIDVEDSDMYEAEDMMINVDVSQSSRSRVRVSTAGVRLPRAEVMFTVPRALIIYKNMRASGFPLPTLTAVRYGVQEGVPPDSVSYLPLAPSLPSRLSTISSATRHDSHVDVKEPLGRDYVFDFGKYSGLRFEEAPESYLRTIGGQLDVYEPRHPGLREAFDYYRPGQARLVPPKKLPPKKQPQGQPQSQTRPLLPVAPKRKGTETLSETWKFRKGPHKGKRLFDVPENYIRSVEKIPAVLENWPGFKAALQDFNRRTGRMGRT